MKPSLHTSLKRKRRKPCPSLALKARVKEKMPKLFFRESLVRMARSWQRGVGTRRSNSGTCHPPSRLRSKRVAARKDRHSILWDLTWQLRVTSSRYLRTAFDHAIPGEAMGTSSRLARFVRMLLGAVNREWAFDMDAHLKRRIKAAAEERFRVEFPNRHVNGSRLWSDEEGYFVVAVFQLGIRPSNSPIFFRVDKKTGVAELEADQLRHRPRGLK